jgi:plastocyanin
MKSRVLFFIVVGMLAGATAIQAQTWGDLTAKFVLDGTAPKPKAITVTKDQEVCGKHALVDESLVVNSTNNGIETVIVYLYVNPRGGKQPPVHESYKSSAKDEVVFDNAKCRFEPHVCVVRTSQTLVVGNKDNVGHNTNVSTLKNPAQNILIPAAGKLKMNFTIEESLPSGVSCNIHPWMKAYIVVKEHPYVGVSDKDGKVTIKNIPAGKWTFQFWQEAAGFVQDVKQDGKTVKWEKGRIEIDIKAGKPNDLGEIKLAPSIFKLN